MSKAVASIGCGSIQPDRGSGGVTPTYDARGNLTSAGSATYTYSADNQLYSAPGGTYRYDALDRMLLNTAQDRRYEYDGDHVMAEYDGNGTSKALYVFGAGADEPLVWYDQTNANDQRRWLATDERGSVVLITKDDQSVLAVNRYDDYGIPQSGNLGRYQYTGQAWLPELGMYDYKARIYSPTLGRFLQTDPIGYADGMNWYNYVGSDPVNGIDPSGLKIPVPELNQGAGGGGTDVGTIGQVTILGYRNPCSLGNGCVSYSLDGIRQALEDAILAQIIDQITEKAADIVVTARKSLMATFRTGFLSAFCAPGGATTQVGVAVAGQMLSIGGTFGAGVAVDPDGNVAGYAFGGAGPGAGLSGDAGASLQISNAKNVGDLSGPFLNTSASVGAGPAGTIDGFVGSSSHGLIAGGGVTVGGGGGASIFSGVTDTVLTPSFNYKSAIGCGS